MTEVNLAQKWMSPFGQILIISLSIVVLCSVVLVAPWMAMSGFQMCWISSFGTTRSISDCREGNH